MSAIVYKLSFPNGKVYIGITRGRFESRLASHRACAVVKSPKLAVHRAWKLHGEPRANIIAIVCDEDLFETEVRAIRAFGSFGDGGYNLTLGGDASPAKSLMSREKIRMAASSPERIEKLRAVHIGSKRSDETKARMSKMRIGQGKGVPKSAEHRCKIGDASRGNTHNVGRRHSTETIMKMSESAKRRWAK